MRILNAHQQTRLQQVLTKPTERFFIELWHELTHPLSLDSYRTRCLNLRTIVKELAHELRCGLINDAEIASLLTEVQEFLSEDALMATRYPENLRLFGGLLTEHQKLFNAPTWDKNKDRTARSDAIAKLQIFAEDLVAELNGDPGYRANLCRAIPDQVAAGNKDCVASLTGALLSDLTQQGWTLNALHEWHKKFLSPESHAFDDNLKFLLREVQRPPQSFQVVLRILGSSRLALPSIEQSIGSPLSKKAPAAFCEKATTDRQRRFLREDKLVTFVEEEVEAVDATGAAIAARSTIEHVLDLVRFDYERSPLRAAPETPGVATPTLVPHPLLHRPWQSRPVPARAVRCEPGVLPEAASRTWSSRRPAGRSDRPIRLLRTASAKKRRPWTGATVVTEWTDVTQRPPPPLRLGIGRCLAALRGRRAALRPGRGAPAAAPARP